MRLAALSLLGLTGLAPDEEAPRRPNVVLVLTDDQGSVDVGAYGARDLETPAMDRLARDGVRFTTFYSAAPSCSPSRAALLTGKSPQAAGVPGNVSPRPGATDGLPASQVTLSERFQEAGYRTALVGKWHLGHAAERRPGAQGFQSWFGHLVGCIDSWSHFFYWDGPNRHDLWRDDREVFLEGRHFLDLMTEEVLRVVDEAGKEPFFLYWAINAPHYPYQGDTADLEAYRARGVAHPRDLYGAFVTSLDRRLGRLLDRLEERGLRDDTIVVLLSDHGHSTEVRAHGGGGGAGPYRGAKFSLFEGGLRVPAIVSWPGRLPEGEVRGQVASSIDWVPTLLELCGLPPAGETLSGRSLVPVLRDASAAGPHEFLVWEAGDSWAVREGRWKLLFQPRDTSAGAPLGDGADEQGYFLADLETDVGERRNASADHPEHVRALAARHAAWVAAGHALP